MLVSLTSFSQGKSKKAVFIIVDGIAADVIEKLDPPNLKKISNIGGFAHTIVGGEKGGYSQTPTISAVGYNSVLTGTWVNKHNVWDNDIAQPNYNYPTIFRLLKTQYPNKKIGVFSSWLDNRTKLVGDNFKATGDIAVDYKFDGLELDTVNYPHDKQRSYMHRIDEKVVDEAASFIRDKGPDLSWVYLEYTDDMGHMHGDSPEFYKAIGYADQQVGRIWDAIEQRQKNNNEDWLIVITTDHGRDSATGHNHGGQSNRERSGWIVTNAKNLNDHFKKNESAMVDIMPTIARFMDIDIPADIAREVDGIPLTGNISFTDLSAVKSNGKAQLSWKAREKSGTVKIWVSATNAFKTGGKDEYHLVGEYPLTSQKATIDLQKMPSDFYKIVVEGKNNRMGRWLK
jgi:predicted AlkP superfamily pyrophosphatase or phosphodiesterase